MSVWKEVYRQGFNYKGEDFDVTVEDMYAESEDNDYGCNNYVVIVSKEGFRESAMEIYGKWQWNSMSFHLSYDFKKMLEMMAHNIMLKMNRDNRASLEQVTKSIKEALKV